MWKWLVGIFLVAALACGGGSYYFATSEQFREMRDRMQGKTPPETVTLEAASKGDLARVVAAPGTIMPRTVVKVSARVSAQITALPFREGDSVKEGDVVCRLDARDLAAQLEQAQAGLKADEARLEGARAGLTQSRLELERVRSLHQSKDKTDAELQSAEASFAQADSGLRATEQSIAASRAAVTRSERDLDNTVIASPIAGTIVKLDSEVGETVLGTASNAGTIIMEIADLSVMLMKAEVDESNVVAVKKGQTAKVFINSYPGREFHGTIEAVGHQLEYAKDGRGYFDTEILLDLTGLPSGETLRNGIGANADIEVEKFVDVVKVPSQAVLDRRLEDLPADARARVEATKLKVEEGKGKEKDTGFVPVVFTMKDGKAVAVPVSVGPSNLKETVILGGLTGDERVITGPYKALLSIKDGADVKEPDAVQPPTSPAAPADAAVTAKN